MQPTARTILIAAAALALPFGAVACGSDDGDDMSAETTEAPDASGADTTMAPDDDMGGAAEPFGAGCAAVPEDGDGSFAGMAEDPVATAASNNPALSTLVTAVDTAGLVDTLNGAEDITVFAPTNDAFEALDAETLQAALDDPEGLLTDVLQNHVVAGRLAPEDLAGDHETLGGGTITVEGADEDFTVGEAAVVCGDVQTSNATVYIIDGVLLPQ
jgi:uncharacterized surface protein with fasciclin (FAS1) repeats